MKVLLICSSDHHTFPVGGQLTVVKNFLNCIQRDVDVLLAGITTDSGEKIGKWTYRKFSNREYPFLPVAFYHSDSMHRKPVVPIRMGTVLGLFRYKQILQCRHFDLIYIHAPELAIPFLLPQEIKIPIVYHIHGIPEYAAINSRYALGRALNSLYKTMARWVIRKTDRLIWVSEEGLRYYKTFHSVKGKSVVIPTSVDTEKFKPLFQKEARQLWDFREKDKIIIFVGRLARSKGLNLLLEAFQLLVSEDAQVKLVLAGDGDERHRLESKVKQLRIQPNVIFQGRVEHNQLPELINCADLAAFSSIKGEGFPVALIEILACGVPIVSTNVGDIRKIVKNGKTGFLINGGNPQIFANALLNGLKTGKSMKRNCVETAGNYSAQTIAKRIVDVLRTVL